MPPGYVLVFNSTSGSSGLGNAHALARNMSASVVSPQDCSGMLCMPHLIPLLAASHVNNSSPTLTLACNMSAGVVSPQDCSGMHCFPHLVPIPLAAPHVNTSRSASVSAPSVGF